MEVLAIIQARGGSKGIPRKNVKLLGGHPLIAYSIVAAKRSPSISRFIVSTDDDEIAQTARQYDAEVPFIRPSEYAQDHSTDIEVFKHALSWLEKHERYTPDVVVQLRPTCPFRPIGIIDKSLNIMSRNLDATSVRSVSIVDKTPYKMWTKDRESDKIRPLVECEYSEQYDMPRQYLPEVYSLNGIVDTIRVETIKKSNSMTGCNVYPLIVARKYFVDIDENKDWEIAERKIKDNNLKIYTVNNII